MAIYQLSNEAELDLENIAEYTINRHGETQMYVYIAQLEADAEQLANGKGQYKELKEVHANLRVKKSGKHYIFGLIYNKAPMVVIAILHERMDLLQRLQNRLI